MHASARRFALAASVGLVIAACGGGGSGGSTPPPPPPPPAAPGTPSALVATPGNAQVSLSWGSVTGATSYTVYRATSTGVSKTSYQNRFPNVAANTLVQTGLTNGTTYYYAVTAVNAGGESAASLEASAKPATNPAPASPGGVTATAGNGQVTVSWSAVSGATSYTVYEGSATVTHATGTAYATSSTSLVRSGLTNGTTYYYVVTASNANGESTDSARVSATPVAPPAAPAGLTATAGDGQVSLSWSAAAGATSYTVYRGTSTGVTKSTYVDRVQNVSATSYVSTGLTNGTTYYFVVTASNAAGEGAESTEANARPMPPLPAAPTNAQATAGDGQVTVTWNAVTGATSYTVYWGPSGVTTATATGSVTSATTSKAVSSLSNGTTYYFIVTASNLSGESAASSAVSATPQPPPPAAPGNVAAAAGDGQVTISWNGVTGATKYNVYRKAGSAPTKTVYDNKDANVTSPRTQSGLTNGQVYYFIVTAENAGGESVASSTVNATPASAGTYAFQGVVTGPAVEGVRVSLSTGASIVVGADGAYSFSGLTSGQTYTVTPSREGYGFTPSSRTATIAAANVTGNFTQYSTITSYTISGAIAYTGSATGRIYVWALPTGCGSSECAAASTSVSRTGNSTPYSIRGLAGGTYTIVARLDNLGSGVEHATNPRGQAGPVTTSLSVTTRNVTLSDPSSPTLAAPAGARGMPGNGGVFVTWDTPVDGNGLPIATSYRVTWGTDATATDLGSTVVPDRSDNWVIVPLGSGTYYFKVHAQLGGSDSAAAATGAVVVGAAGAGHSVSGTVTRPSDKTGDLFVVVTDDMNVFQWVRIPSPAVSQSFTVAGVPSGNYGVYVLLDVNGNGYIDDGDLQAQSTVTVSTSDVTGKDATLAYAGYVAKLKTSHGKQSGSAGEWYNLTFDVRSVSKQVASVAILSGNGLPLPFDLPKKPWSFEAWTNGGMARPTVGDAYAIEVVYADGTKAAGTMTVTGVLDNFPQNLAVQTTTPGSPSVPLLTWQAPAVAPPGGYSYSVGFFSNAQWWYPDGDAGLPSTTRSVLYNVDGMANPATLSTGTTYQWYVNVRDANGNEAQLQQTYTPTAAPPTVDFSSAIQGTWAGCFADPTADYRINFAFSGASGTYNEWSYPSTDGTCTGTETPAFNEEVTFTLGAGVWAPFGVGGPDVAAQQIDYTLVSDGSLGYDIVYIDTGATPNLLYFGETSVMNGNYPAVINSAGPFTKQ